MADPSNPITDKDPHLFGKAKEQIEAVKKPENSPRHDEETHGKSGNIDEDTPIEAVKKPENSPRHDEETHGKSGNIDEDTPVDKVKGPGVFQRMKEEVEAVVEAVLPKK